MSSTPRLTFIKFCTSDFVVINFPHYIFPSPCRPLFPFLFIQGPFLFRYLLLSAVSLVLSLRVFFKCSTRSIPWISWQSCDFKSTLDLHSLFAGWRKVLWRLPRLVRLLPLSYGHRWCPVQDARKVTIPRKPFVFLPGQQMVLPWP